jgi:hypothetical protein
MSEPIYNIVDGIKIYDGTTADSREEYTNRINYLKHEIKDHEPLFTPIQPSTLTAQGCMSNIGFEEKHLIEMLSPPVKHILKIGCNYGELFHSDYVPPEPKKTSGRGRKPKPKKKTKRKIQGNGRYFSSQVTFMIEHPDTLYQYKIKMFRNGVFQVPGIRNPDMQDLVKPIEILRKYLAYNFGEDVQVLNFMAVMRNYKSKLINENLHVHLERLEDLIFKDKLNPKYEQFLDYMLRSVHSSYSEKIKEMVGTFNPLNIAEMTYNTDRCFCLIIKFYRPSILDPKKKTTVKLLKKGKINFDGGNSEQEVEELYYWLQYIYHLYKDQILFDIKNITKESDSDTSDCSYVSIYDDDEDYADDDEYTEELDEDSETINEERKEFADAVTHHNYMRQLLQPRPKSSSKYINQGDLIMKALRKPVIHKLNEPDLVHK